MSYPPKIYLLIDDICSDSFISYEERGAGLRKKGFWPYCPEECSPEWKEQDFLKIPLEDITETSLHELLHTMWKERRLSEETMEFRVRAMTEKLLDRGKDNEVDLS